MIAPSLISVRRFAPPVRHRVTLALAGAWEALAETHRQHAVRFVRTLRTRLGTEDALQRYFREVAVPALMQETVRARALLELAVDEPLEHDAVEGFSSIRPDHLIEALRRRAQYVETVNLAVRLAAAVADEAVTATHLASALRVTEVLDGTLLLDEALAFYIRAFDLPSVQAQVVFQRALAELAGRQLAAELAASAPAEAPRPVLTASRGGPAFGLRAIG
jgi:hypothetical protein